MPTTPFRRRPLIEELEPRLLFSADLAPMAFDGLAPASEQRVLDPSGEFSAPAVEHGRELVIVDRGVENAQTLIEDILHQRGDRQIEIVLLDAGRDGVEQIGEILGPRSGLDAVHLISHGSAGTLQLGSQTLDANTLSSRATEIQSWATALSADADILLYGCNVAESETGEAFIAALSQLTGADIAASSDKTGSAGQGDWLLEAQRGTVETRLLLGETRMAWQGALDIAPAASQSLANNASGNNQTTTGAARQVAINPTDGSFAVVWTSPNQDGDGNGVYLRRFDAAGNPLTAEIRVNTTTTKHQQAPSIAMDDNGKFVVVWESENQDGSGYGIYAQRFNADASKAGGEFRVNATATSDQTNASIGMDAAGNFVVAWQSANQDGDGWGIYAQRFNASGSTIGSEFKVNSNTTGNQTQPAVAMNDAGAFVIVWRTDDGNKIRGRLFDAAGTTVKPEFDVNPPSLITTDRSQPDVVMNASGEFVVAYSFVAATDTNVWVVRFDAAGNRQGFGIQANQYYSGAQTNPSLALDDSGGFVVVWDSYGQDSNGNDTAVVARHFKADYSAYANETVVNLALSGDQSAPGVALHGASAVFIWSGKGAEDSQGVYFRQATILQTNLPPVITSNGGGNSASLSIAENGTAVTTVAATDEGVGALVYSLSGGADAGLFAIDPASGVLRFINPPDYDAPADADRDNIYEVQVSVTDDRGGTDTQTLLVAVTNVNEAPVANPNSYSPTQDSTLTVNIAYGVLPNDADPDGDPLTASLVAGPAHGTLTLGTDGSFTYSPDPGFHETDSFSYRAFDGSLYSNIVTVNLNVSAVNHAPTPATAPVTLTPAVPEDGSRLITEAELLTGASDANGDTLTVSDLAIVSGGGSIVSHGNGTWTYTPSSDDDTAVGFSYTLSDGEKTAAGSATLDIVPVNDAPASDNDTAVTDEDTPVTLAVTGNDSDPESDTLMVVGVTQGTNGSVSFSGGSISYTPNPDFHGDDNFTYTVSDGNGGFDTAIVYVTVTPVNDAPTVATLIADQGATEGTAFNFQFASTVFSDVDAGDTLTYTVSGLPSWLSFDAATRTFSGTPANGDVGTHTLTVRATDSGGLWVEDQFDVVVGNTNDAPVLAPIGNRVVNEGATLTFTATASDPDVPANTLSYSLAGAPAGATIDAGTGVFSWTPSEAQGAGVYSFDVVVSDGAGGFDSETISVTVYEVNAAPSGANTTVTTNEDTAYTLTTADFGFTDPSDSPANALLAVKITTLPGAGSLTNNGVAVTAGQFVSLADISGGRLKFTPAANANGAAYASFTFQVQDDGGTAHGGVDLDATPNTITLNVTAVNDAPSVSPVDLGALNEDGNLLISQAMLLAGASDVDLDALSAISLTQTSGSGTLTDNGNGTWTFTPNADWNGTVSFSFDVFDGTASTPNTASLAVNPVNDAPIVSAVDLGTVNEDGSLLITQAMLLAGAGDVDLDALSAINLTQTSGSGTLTNNGDSTWTFTPNADWNGGVAFSFDVFDGTASTPNTANLFVNPVNDAPTATPVTLAPIAEDSGPRLITQVELLAGAGDIDGTTLTAVNLAIASGSGTLTDNGDGSWTFTPNANWNGAVSFGFDVTDGMAGTANTAGLAVNPVNDAPMVAPINLGAINEDGSLVITQAMLLAGSFDMESNPLTAINLTLIAGSGALTDNGGSWTFTPDANWNGAVGFGFEVTDGTAGTPNTADLTISPVNDAPVFVNNTLSLSEGSTVVLGNANLNVADPEQGAAQLTYSISNLAHGQFEWVATPGTAITAFTQADIDAGRVAFVHDASDFAPSYDVTVGDGVASSGPNAATILFTPVDEGINITSLSGASTTEAGGTVSFDVTLNSQPIVDVTVFIASGNPAEGTASLSSLTFTAANWNVAQQVTVTGMDDFVDDGDKAYLIQIGAAVSADRNYSGLPTAGVALSNLDDDTAGIVLAPTAGLITDESGASDNFSVVLTSQPLADVVIGLSSSNAAEGTLSTATLTFTPANWNLPQQVTVTGVNDVPADGDIAYRIVAAPASSADAGYDGLVAGAVDAINRDVAEPAPVAPAPAGYGAMPSQPSPTPGPSSEAGAPEAPQTNGTTSTAGSPAPSGAVPLPATAPPADLQSVDPVEAASYTHRMPGAPRLVSGESAQHTVLSNHETQGGVLLRLLEILQAESSLHTAGDTVLTPAIQVDIAQDKNFRVEVLTQGARITTVSLSVGAVWWALRAGGLFTSLLTSLPAWRSFDVLPVLSRDEDEDDASWDFGPPPEAEDAHDTPRPAETIP